MSNLYMTSSLFETSNGPSVDRCSYDFEQRLRQIDGCAEIEERVWYIDDDSDHEVHSVK